MSKDPPWFSVSGDSLIPGAAVLPVGKQTCPRCRPESDGGDPESWGVAMSHADLITLNQEKTLTITFSGTWETDWERVQISESGSASSCALRVTRTTGESGTLEYEFISTSTIAKSPCLAIATGYGVLGNGSGGEITTQSSALAVKDRRAALALCGSTGCSSSQLDNYNHDFTGSLEATFDGGGWSEAICRTATGYRYTFTGVATVSLSASEFVRAYLYTGAWDEARWVGLPVPTDPEYMLEDETVVGSVRGAAIRARLLSYAKDRSASSVTGSAGNCPSPAYSSDVTTGETTGTIAVMVSG